MMRVAILGSSLPALECAHKILDKKPSSEIKVYTEDAEVGFSEGTQKEKLLLNETLRSIPEHWYTSIPLDVDQKTPSIIADFWLCKAMAIALVSRGVHFVLRTRILDLNEESREISYRGGGLSSSGIDPYDELYDFR